MTIFHAFTVDCPLKRVTDLEAVAMLKELHTLHWYAHNNKPAVSKIQPKTPIVHLF